MAKDISNQKEDKKKVQKKVEKEKKTAVLNKNKEKKTSSKKEETKKKSLKVENKSVQNKVIENIKSFISKIIEMQEKVKQDEEEEKKNKEIEKKETVEEEILNSNPKYLLEYYDLPYRYNETVVKILAQTPKRLFVYWDISDKDKNTYLNAFGESFFEDTYPVLLVHNENKNYTREIVINDFANSWYIDITDARNKYTIQLGRKFKSHVKPYINVEEKNINIELNNDYLFIAMSNKLEVPNDHVLFEEFKPYVKYRNVKTNVEEMKDVTKIIYNNEILELYNKLYDGEIDINSYEIKNPSSMGTSSIAFK